MRKEKRIYGLADPRDSRVRYVGATVTSFEYRLTGHFRKPTNRKMRKWLTDLSTAGLRPVMFELPREYPDWANDERGWIACFRRMGGLLNVEAGGPHRPRRRRRRRREADPLAKWCKNSRRIIERFASTGSIHPTVRKPTKI
jgi:hypothetical protein